VSINPRTTNKRNPDAAALSGPRMADTMASDTEPSALPNAEQSAVVPEAEQSAVVWRSCIPTFVAVRHPSTLRK